MRERNLKEGFPLTIDNEASDNKLKQDASATARKIVMYYRTSKDPNDPNIEFMDEVLGNEE